MRTGFAIAFLGVALLIGPAFADAGGGGGNMGSYSTPGSAENPAEAYRAGIAALQASNYAEAIRNLRIAQRAAPNEPNVNYALGLAYVGADQQPQARRSFERAVRDENAPAGAWLQLGLLHLRLGERAEAEEQRTALTQMLAACGEGCTEQRRAQLQAALTALTQALEQPAPAAPTTGWNFPGEGEGRAAYAAAVGLINQERYEDGLAALRTAGAAIGPHPDILNYMGFASRKLGRYDAALGYYREALALAPDHLGANEYLGELYLELGRLADARRQLARLDELCAYGCTQREELGRWIEARY